MLCLLRFSEVADTLTGVKLRIEPERVWEKNEGRYDAHDEEDWAAAPSKAGKLSLAAISQLEWDSEKILSLHEGKESHRAVFY